MSRRLCFLPVKTLYCNVWNSRRGFSLWSRNSTTRGRLLPSHLCQLVDTLYHPHVYTHLYLMNIIMDLYFVAVKRLSEIFNLRLSGLADNKRSNLKVMCRGAVASLQLSSTDKLGRGVNHIFHWHVDKVQSREDFSNNVECL